MNYCDLNEYEDYIENIEFFLKEKCCEICGWSVEFFLSWI